MNTCACKIMDPAIAPQSINLGGGAKNVSVDVIERDDVSTVG